MGTHSDQLFERLRTALGPRYRILDHLGTGGMGVVYSAEDHRHGRRVAVKIMDDVVADSVGASRFLKEIEIAARLQHPHILPLFDSGDVGGLIYYVMPLVAGESLRELIDREKQLSLKDVCRITRQVASALAYAHSQGVIHRDIKPHNVLLSNGDAVVADFGIAKAVTNESGDRLTISGVVLGTPSYMSPEQATGQRDLDGRSDQYSLACVVYEMIVGTPPFSAATRQGVVARHVSDPPPPIRSVRGSVPRRMEQVIEIALAKVPGDRFRTVAEFAEALESALSEFVHAGSGTARETGPPSVQQRPMNTGRLVSKTCDRWSQVNGFDSHLRTSWKTYPCRPQVFVIHGDEGEGHDSLLERLCETTISRFAEEIDGPERASIIRIHAPWPEAEDLEIARRDIAISLFREADPRHIDDDLTPAGLRKCINDRLGSVAVVHHDVRPRAWHRRTPQLIDWYVNQFWGSIQARRGDPQFLIFLKVIYPARASAGFLRTMLAAAASRRQRIAQALGRLSSDPARCGWMVFNELQSVTVDDVKDWFSKNSIYESEHQREVRANAVFKDAVRKRMVDIESALVEIHEAAVSAQPFTW